MEVKSKERVLLIVLLFVFFACIFRYIPGFVPDLECFISWAVAIKNHGLRSVYTQSGTNYLPFYQYILYIYTKLAGSEEDIVRYIRDIRLFTLLFEVIGIWYIYKWIDKKTDFMMLVFISLLNIGFSYNNVAWGQIDGIFSAFLFIAIYYAYKQDMFWSSVWMVLALNAKLQAVIFVPLWLIFLLNNLLCKRNIKALLIPLLTIALVQFLIILPFLTRGTQQLEALWKVVTNSDNTYPRIGMEACNIWHILLPKETIYNVPDKTIYTMGLSYKQLGLLMFCISSALAMLPVLRDVFYTIKFKRNALQNRERIWLSAALVCLCFYFFNTQMHERYCHPVIFFLTAYAFYTRKFGLYILFSLIYFLNLELVLSDSMYPHPHYDWFTRPNLAWMFGITMLIMFIKLYTVKNDNADVTPNDN